MNCPTSDTISHALCAHIHFTQVYNETIRDLLVPSGPLDLREDTQKGLVVNKLTRYQVSRYDAYHRQGERTNYTLQLFLSFFYTGCETMRKKDFSGEQFDGQRSLPVCWLYNPLSFPSPKRPMRSWACWRLATGTGRSTPLMPTPHPHGHMPSFRWVYHIWWSTSCVVLISDLHSGFLPVYTINWDTVVRVQVKQVWYRQTRVVNRRFRQLSSVWNGCGEEVCGLPGNFQCTHT